MTRAQPIKLGPFVGGMNTASDESAVAENELVDCVNLELDLDGSLLCRPPIVETTSNSATTTERLVMIGRAILAGVKYVIASNSDGTYAFNGTTWVTVRAGLQARVALQYQDLLFVVAQTGSVNNGGYWDGTTWTTDASMPKGEAAVFYKSRLFVVPGILATGAAAHQLRFTDPISVTAPTPLVWTATNLIPVSQGDGQNLVDIQIYNDNIMLFKQDSTYVFAYDIQLTDGVLRQINDNIGATTRKCVVSYENSVYVYHEGNVFEVNNYNFQRINLRVPFLLDESVPASTTRVEEVFLSLFGDRLLVRYFNRIYVYSLRTKTWSRWESVSPFLHNLGPLVEFPNLPTEDVNNEFYAGSCISSHENVFVIKDGYDAYTAERTVSSTHDIECMILTKNFDFGESYLFKKLAWWGADVLSNHNIVAIATPVSIVFASTWADLHGLTWDELLTWDFPVGVVGAVETGVDDDSVAQRKFVKFLKALRFRQINFRLTLLCNGTTSDGPARIFSLTGMVGVKQTVSKQVT